MGYPYDPATLHPAITRVLTPYAPYATATAIGKIVEERALIDGNSLICWAHFLWTDALATDFDEDVVQFGAEAAAVLSRIPAQDARAGAAARLGKQIAARVKRARRDLAKIERLDEVPEASLGRWSGT